MPLYLSAHPEIHFITKLETRLPMINLDKDQIKRVLLNLIENAIAAIKSAGEPISAACTGRGDITNCRITRMATI